MLASGACSGDDGQDGGGDDRSEEPVPRTPELAERDDPLPTVTPTPQDIRWLGPDVAVTAAATVVAGPEVDEGTITVLTEVLEGAGATDVTVTSPPADSADGGLGGTSGGDRESGDTSDGDETSGDGEDSGGDDGDGDGDGDGEHARLTVYIGAADDAALAAALDDVGVTVPADLPAEGYALAAHGWSDGSGTVVLAGADDAGTFYAAQTLRQLSADGSVAGVGIVDHPTMQHRGTVEGFYGSPWTTDERLDQLAFYGRFKLNTYIYAPKDEPYHRDRWRDPYPADRLADVRALVDAAAANHVRFTFAVSPGVSICYSSPDDLAALSDKLASVYDLGVRSFSIALDDI
ncbi:MAG: beta-N-acetylglucosaminidase domain-containing protein, partial [Acidimicrobiales bacterium]|nr:beta-N-acetylglucosaminidase domain-containing protein [Acidimicrobiales bacterium]